MQSTQTPHPKTLKDAVRSSIRLVSFVRLFAPLGLLGFLIGGVYGILAAAVLSIIASFFTERIAEGIGGRSAGFLFGVGRRTINQRDRAAGTLNQARHHKMNRRFEQALNFVDEVLAADGDNPEALYLKAQILWDGFKDRSAAKELLLQLMKAEPDKEGMYHRWAVNFYGELNKIARQEMQAERRDRGD